MLFLRTYIGIRHFDISGEEEIAIINLDALPDAVAKELETMHKILETSRKPQKKSKIKLERKEEEKTELTKWFK